MINLLRLTIIAITTFLWSFAAFITGFLNRFIPIYHYIARDWAKKLMKLCGVKITVKGLENIKLNKQYIMISNHSSLFDIPILLSTLPHNIKMLAKKELSRIPIFGWALWAGDYIYVENNNPLKSIKIITKACKQLKKGSSILIFPEGGRSENGKVAEFKKGAFVIAKKSNLDIIPISIIGAYDLMSKHTLKLKPQNIKVIINNSFNTKNINKDELSEKTRNIILQNCE